MTRCLFVSTGEVSSDGRTHYKCSRPRCPNKMRTFNPPERCIAECLGWMLVPPPGDALKWFIEQATDRQVRHGEYCEKERQRMNAMGWRCCLMHSPEIWQRVKERAAKEKIQLTKRTALGYAWKVAWKWLLVGWRVVTTP